MPTVSGLRTGVTLAFSVRDRKASATWYGEHLGCSLLYDAEGISWCEMTTHLPGLSIGFAERDEIAVGGPVPTWDVENLDTARAGLERQGVAFDGPTVSHEGVAKLATFFDPDGHALMLAQNLASPPHA